MTEKTFTIIKPDSVRKKVEGDILQRLLDEGFAVRGLRLLHMSKPQAEGFYAVHRDKPFFGELVEFMTSGPAYVACLERENAVAHLRAVMGPTDSKKAPADTIRGQFGTDIQANAIHGSDSPENARIEIAYFFADSDLVAAGCSEARGNKGAGAADPAWGKNSLQRPPRIR